MVIHMFKHVLGMIPTTGSCCLDTDVHKIITYLHSYDGHTFSRYNCKNLQKFCVREFVKLPFVRHVFVSGRAQLAFLNSGEQQL